MIASNVLQVATADVTELMADAATGVVLAGSDARHNRRPTCRSSQ